MQLVQKGPSISRWRCSEPTRIWRMLKPDHAGAWQSPLLMTLYMACEHRQPHNVVLQTVICNIILPAACCLLGP